MATSKSDNSNSKSNGYRPIDLRPDLLELWDEKFNFNQKVLRLNPQKAAEWANRTIAADKEAETMFG